jgi:hypothetical protein
MASSEPNPLPQDILDKISAYLQNANKLVNIMVFFCKDNAVTQRTIQILRTVIHMDEVFQGIVDRLVEDTEKLKNDENYYPVMAAIWNYHLKPKIEHLNEVGGANLSSVKTIVSSMDSTEASLSLTFIAILSRLTTAKQYEIVQLIKDTAELVGVHPSSLDLLNQSFNNLLKVTTSPYGNAISVGLLPVFLTYDIWNHLRRWWKDEITGEQCAKNIIKSCAGVAGGVAGGFLGAAVGNYFENEIGIFVEAVVGGVVGSALSYSLSQWLTEYFFKSPKEKALEDAYKFLQLNSDASVDEINTNFRRLVNEFDPNIVGSNDNFQKLQYYMSIIKLDKGEF